MVIRERSGKRTVEERLHYYSLPMGEHLMWCGSSDGDGYGQISVDGQPKKTHRLAWEFAYGPIPAGVNVLHLCPGEPPPCIEPTHLYLGTQMDNVADAIRAGRPPGQPRRTSGGTTEARIKTARRRAKKQGLLLYKCRGAADVAKGLDLYVLADENNVTVFGGKHKLADLADVEKYLGDPRITRISLRVVRRKEAW